MKVDKKKLIRPISFSGSVKVLPKESEASKSIFAASTLSYLRNLFPNDLNLPLLEI
jgi:hypothetical protein